MTATGPRNGVTVSAMGRQRRAEEPAGLAGRTLGAALEINESASFRPPTPVLRSAPATESAPPPPIEAGTTKVTVELNVVFEMDPQDRPRA